MKILIIMMTAILLTSCSYKRIQTGDDVLLVYSIKNMRGERIDGNVLPSGDTLPLRIVIGKSYLSEGFERQIIGMRKGENKEYILPSEEAYKNNGVFYLNNRDTNYIIRPAEKLKINITILSFN